MAPSRTPTQEITSRESPAAVLFRHRSHIQVGLRTLNLPKVAKLNSVGLDEAQTIEQPRIESLNTKPVDEVMTVKQDDAMCLPDGHGCEDESAQVVEDRLQKLELQDSFGNHTVGAVGINIQSLVGAVGINIQSLVCSSSSLSLAESESTVAPEAESLSSSCCSVTLPPEVESLSSSCSSVTLPPDNESDVETNDEIEDETDEETDECAGLRAALLPLASQCSTDDISASLRLRTARLLHRSISVSSMSTTVTSLYQIV
eukprot:gnl/TRDRNA2_/TRDRNA2_172048_c0_seq3.p1 gnl/TRDRNA2_/TRDRNA2_172048_c0~~gnl/TRDRNA2_/TRDRNA2_172048_c0_seq3.p1  ORF type:complete len:259 (+),score=32.00 gnl/TRDRNA2_/TRDRNA2_172048_c0_seq3:114-890(+)